MKQRIAKWIYFRVYWIETRSWLPAYIQGWAEAACIEIRNRFINPLYL